MVKHSFLDFPGEIRNQIYNELLLVPTISKPRSLGDPPIYPQILSTCRKIHEETNQILYACNTFLAHPSLLSDRPRLRLYYDIIPATLVPLIRRYHIRVRLDCDPNFTAQRASDAFTGVDDFTIEVFQAQFGSSDHKVLRLFEGIRGVEQARIYGSVIEFPEYVQWLHGSMMAAVGSEVEPFDKGKVGQAQVRGYDI